MKRRADAGGPRGGRGGGAGGGRGRKSSWTPLKPDAADADAGDNAVGGGSAGGRRVGKHGVSMGARGVYDVRNTLNDLTRGEWRAFTQAVVANRCGPLDAYSGADDDRPAPGTLMHPERFPDGLAECMVGFFTKRGGSVMDPFAGTGGTLTACDRMGRRGTGLELYEKWASVARNRTRQTVVCADAMDAAEIVGDTSVDLLLTGIPRHVPSMYRMTDGRYIPSGIDPADVSHADTYGQYMDGVARRMEIACGLVRPGGHAVAVVQNEIGWGGRCIPAAFDIAGRMSRLDGVRFLGEKVWLAPCQQRRAIPGATDGAGVGGGPMHGYPHRYAAEAAGASGLLYCMVFRRLKKRVKREGN